MYFVPIFSIFIDVGLFNYDLWEYKRRSLFCLFIISQIYFSSIIMTFEKWVSVISVLYVVLQELLFHE